MNVIAKRTLIAFCDGLAKSEQTAAKELMTAWHKTARSATWTSFADIEATFNTTDWVGGKVVFDIGANKYHVACEIAFKAKRVFILFVSMHKNDDDADIAAL